MAFLRAIVEMWPSPTKDSSKGYVIWFQFVNSFFGSIIRAFRSQVENSPNFQDAVKKFIVENPDVVKQHLRKGATMTSNESLWKKVEGIFHKAETDVDAAGIALFGKANFTAFATSAKQVLKTELGVIVVSAVKAAEGMASGAEAHQAAFSQIASAAKTAGITAETSVVNMLIELAVQAVRGAFGAGVI